MSKKPYDFLVSEKEPLLYLEASILRMDDGFLTVLSGKGGTRTIAPSRVLMMQLASRLQVHGVRSQDATLA